MKRSEISHPWPKLSDLLSFEILLVFKAHMWIFYWTRIFLFINIRLLIHSAVLPLSFPYL